MKQFRLEMTVSLPAEAFAEAAALMAVQPVVKTFVDALREAKIEAKVHHDVVAVRGKKAKPVAAAPPRAVA